MIAAFAPATVSNVGCGFDVLGFALDGPGDIVIAECTRHEGVEMARITGDGGRLPFDPLRNTAGAATLALLDRLECTRGIRLTIHKGIPLASGAGSSAASAAAAVTAVNELLGGPAPAETLLECAIRGEAAGCGAAHADNVAPALLGGFVLVRGGDPPDPVRLPVPDGLRCVVLHPHAETDTRNARAMLGDTVPLPAAIRQWANVGALVAGLCLNDFDMIGKAIVDHVAEPVRASLVPGFDEVKEAARLAGALGCSISGSGPSMFALCPSPAAARNVAAAMLCAFKAATPIDADVWSSRVGGQGAHIRL